MPPDSIGRVHGNHGNVLVVLRALTYMRALGGTGLRRVAERAVLNARYLEQMLTDVYDIPFPIPCMHEFVASAATIKKQTGVRAMDIAKALLVHGFHSPTVYFPLIVSEALMIEPTETESKRSLDHFVDVMIEIARESESNPEVVRSAPTRTPVGRLDEVRASKDLDVSWRRD